MIRVLLLLLSCCVLIKSRHFNGGIIEWTPIYPSTNTSVVSISITQTYFWTADIMNCSVNVPTTTINRSGENANLTCVADCSTDGGYSLNPINILTDCQTVNTVVNTMSSQRSRTINLTSGAYFRLSYAAGDWIALNYPVITGLKWSMVSSIDLRPRSDGFINTPPIASIISPQYVIVNRTTPITIGVWDNNLSDDVRCRWAINGTVSECAGVCYPSSVPNGTYLSGCTIHFIAYVVNTTYAIAIQIEDFIDNTTLTPMSSIPVQFLVYVIDAPSCGLAPVILPPDICLEVQVGVPVSFNISAFTLCDPNVSGIESIEISHIITGMIASNTSDSLTNTSVSYATFDWTPQANQLGSQYLCIIAYSDEKLQSSQYCMTFNVLTSSSMCSTTTTSTTTTTTIEITTSSAQTSVDNSQRTAMLIGIVSALGALLLLSACCCLYPLCCTNSTSKDSQEFQRNEIDQESVVAESVAESTGSQGVLIPIIGVRLFRPSVMTFNVIRPFRLSGPSNIAARMPPPVGRTQRIAVYGHV